MNNTYSPKQVARAIDDADAFVDEFDEFVEQARQLGTADPIGGRGLTEDIRKQLNFTIYCDRMRNLEEFARLTGAGRVLLPPL